MKRTKPPKPSKWDLLVQDVLKSIYWDHCTLRQYQQIQRILKDNDPRYLPTEKANDICDYLGIERRGNRQEIVKTLSK